MPWMLAVPAAVIAWFVFVVSLGMAMSRHEVMREAADRRMANHIAKNYPPESGSTEP